MSCKLLAHPSISTYIWAVNIVLTGPCGLSAIPPITIYAVAVFTWVFAVYFALLPSHSGLKHFQYYFSALILFGGTVPIHSIQQSCIMGPSKRLDCHRYFYGVLNSFGNHVTGTEFFWLPAVLNCCPTDSWRNGAIQLESTGVALEFTGMAPEYTAMN